MEQALIQQLHAFMDDLPPEDVYAIITKAVATVGKRGVKERFNDQGHGPLYDAVCNCENTQWPTRAIGFGNGKAFDRLRLIPTLPQVRLQGFEVHKEPGLKLDHGDAVHAGLVGARAHVSPGRGEGVIGIDLFIEA